MNTPSVTEGMVSMPRDDFEELLERAAERGARHSRVAQSARRLQRGEEDRLADGRSDAGHRAGYGNARGGVREVESVWGWAIRHQRGSRYVERGA